MSTTQITIRLPDERVKVLKAEARAQHRSLAQQIEHRLSMSDTRSPLEQDAHAEGLAMRAEEKR